jgi:uncharacterized phage protein gp47/JayE
MSNENVSSFLSSKTREEYSSYIENYMKYGIMTIEYEEFEYITGTDAYTLLGDGVSGSTSILSILSVQGINDDGNWIPPNGNFNGVDAMILGTDYTLLPSGSSTTIPDTGDVLYQQIEFNADAFEDGTKFYVSYIYYDSSRAGSITNFNEGSIIKMFTDAFATSLNNLHSELERVYQSGFVTLATGQDLDNHVIVWGLTRSISSFAEGKVKVINDSTTDDIVLAGNTAIISYVGNSTLIFFPKTGGTVSAKASSGDPANEGDFDVIASTTGKRFNIGSYSITKIYSTTSLANELTSSDITVSNPPTIDAIDNVFTGGGNDETDDELRIRIINVAKRSGRGTLESVKAALETLDIVDKAEIVAWQNNLGLASSLFYVMPISYEGNKILNDTSSITLMNAVVNDYKPISVTYTYTHPMPIMIELSGTITIEDDVYDDAEGIKSRVEDKITEYIQELTIGNDVVYSELIYKAQSVGGVFDFTIDKLNYTEFVTVPPAYDLDTYKLTDNEDGLGTTHEEYFQEVFFLSKGKAEAFTYSGVATADMTYSGINTSIIFPSVYLAIQDEFGNWVRDPGYAVNFYDSATTDSITIDELAGSGVGLTLVSGSSTLLYSYEHNETDTIDGLRVKLYGVIPSGTSPTVMIGLYSGASGIPSGTVLASGIVTVVSGSSDYEVLFGSPLTVDTMTDTHYLIVSGVSSVLVSPGTYASLPVSASGTRGLMGSDLFHYSGATWTLIPNTSMMSHTVIVTSGVSSITIEANALQPDVAVLYELSTAYQSKGTYDILKIN